MLKAITLYQPHASLMALGKKRNETRSRLTHFRGDLAICSAKQSPIGTLDIIMSEPFRSALKIDAIMRKTDDFIIPLEKYYPLGHVLAVVEVFGCEPTEAKSLCPKCAGVRWGEATGGSLSGPCMRCGKIRHLHDIPALKVSAQERAFGDYGPNRYAWMTGNLRRLREPVPVKGRQFLFNLPPDVEARVRAQI